MLFAKFVKIRCMRKIGVFH